MWEVDTLSDLSEEVAEALKAGLPGVSVVDGAPGRFTPPIAIVTPDDPWTEPADRPGHWTVRILVAFIAKGGRKAAKDLDRMVSLSIRALDKFDVISVSAPDDIELSMNGNRTTHWGCVMTLEFEIIFKEES